MQVYGQFSSSWEMSERLRSPVKVLKPKGILRCTCTWECEFQCLCMGVNVCACMHASICFVLEHFAPSLTIAPVPVP